MRYQTFTQNWLEPAVQLLSREAIQAGPGAPTPEQLQSELETLMPEAQGAVALDAEGHLAGFLLAKIHHDRFYGCSARVPLFGHAVSDPAVYAGLYAQASERWVAAGALKHQLQLAIQDLAGQQAWFGLSFGQEQIHGLKALTAEATAAPADEPAIRLAGPQDLDALAPLLSLIQESYARGPVWEPFVPEQREALREAYAEALEDSESRLWIAEQDGRILAFQLYWPEAASLMTPEACWGLSTAATWPQARGQGWQRRLLNMSAHELYGEGARWLQTDWRSTSLTAAQTWPALGFRPVALRLARRLPDLQTAFQT